MMESIPISFLFILPLVAFLYASVGHGGASGYLALMALLNVAPETMKPVALLLNILVSLISFILFFDKKQFPFILFAVLIVASIPLSYLGGGLQLQQHVYKTILGIILLVPAIRIVIKQQDEMPVHRFHILPALLMGAGIGFLSGLIGIGGGIILSPILLMLRWTTIRQTAAISALFIFLNSISGLAGNAKAITLLQHSGQQYMLYAILFSAAIGGLAGSFFGAKKFNTQTIRICLSAVLLIASLKLIFV